MAIEVHFRGVGIFVTDGPRTVTGVLFPNAESSPPDRRRALRTAFGMTGHRPAAAIDDGPVTQCMAGLHRMSVGVGIAAHY